MKLRSMVARINFILFGGISLGELMVIKLEELQFQDITNGYLKNRFVLVIMQVFFLILKVLHMDGVETLRYFISFILKKFTMAQLEVFSFK